MNDVDCETILYVLESVTSEAVPSECDVPSLLWYGKAKDKVFENAIRRYAPGAHLSECLCVHDTSFRKTGKGGMLFTTEGFASDYLTRAEERLSQPVRYDELTHVSLADNGYDDYPDVVLHFRDGRAVRSYLTIYGRYLHLVVNKVLSETDPALAQAREELVPLVPLGYLPAMTADPAEVRRLLALSEEAFDARYEQVMERAADLDMDDWEQRVAVLQEVLDARAAVRARVERAQDVLRDVEVDDKTASEPAEQSSAPLRRRGRHFAPPVQGEGAVAAAPEPEAKRALAPAPEKPQAAAPKAEAPQAVQSRQPAPEPAPRPRIKSIPRPERRWSRKEFAHQEELSCLSADPSVLYQLALHCYHGNGVKRNLESFCNYMSLLDVQGYPKAVDALDFAASGTDRALSSAYRAYLKGRDDYIHRYYVMVAETGDELACRIYLERYGEDERYAQSERDVRYACYQTLAKAGDSDAAEQMVKMFMKKVDEQNRQCRTSELNEVTSVLEKLASEGDRRSQRLLQDLTSLFDESQPEWKKLEAMLNRLIGEYRDGDHEAGERLVKGCLAVFANPSSKEKDREVCLIAMGRLMRCGNSLAYRTLVTAFEDGKLVEHKVEPTGRLESLYKYVVAVVLMQNLYGLTNEEMMERIDLIVWSEEPRG